jgi:alpha-amylase
MSRLDHAGLAGVDPLGAITFVENHDTDRGGSGGPIVRNKLLAYAYILTSEGYPAVFYRDYSKDNNCFGLKDSIDRLIWIHENLASGATTQRWKDNGVFAYERLGGARLLTGLNIDAGNERTIKVATTFGPNADLEEFTGQGHPIRTDGAGNATITIPRNQNGRGYVCYSRPRPQTPFSVQEIETTQEFAGADDLDIGPASTDALSTICRVWVNKGKRIHGALFFDAAHWTATTSIRLELLDPEGQTLKVGNYLASTSQGTPVQVDANETGFHTFRIRAFETPPANARPSFHLKVSYTASQEI